MLSVKSSLSGLSLGAPTMGCRVIIAFGRKRRQAMQRVTGIFVSPASEQFLRIAGNRTVGLGTGSDQ
jgi:hypothetical protein